MVEIEVEDLVWDDVNVRHTARHSVTPSDIDLVISDPNARERDTHTGRIMVTGRAGSRIISVVLAKEKTDKFYVVTARDADKQERRIYRGENYEEKNSKNSKI